MDTPVCDFVRRYTAGNPGRLHMPGHKGKTVLGPEALDITEIPGADVLYAPEGILRESEAHASELFGSVRTVYSTEGSSLCIRAMLYLALQHAALLGRQPRIAAGRNAHRVFPEAAALLGMEPVWLYGRDALKPEGKEVGLLTCRVTPEELEPLFENPETAPTAVYVTSPDYLGCQTDLRPLAELCHRNAALLLVDNAHGAYLRFLGEGLHPLEQGADLCCDSAHKTLPVLTGGAWLHMGQTCPAALLPMADRAMALFASTSPSYLTLQSLDGMNRLLAEGYPARLRETADRIRALKKDLQGLGWHLAGDEPMKITLLPKKQGYTGAELAAVLRDRGIFCEFYDPDYLVLMPSPETGEQEYRRLGECLAGLPKRDPVRTCPPEPGRPNPVMSLREAVLSPFEEIPAEESLGRILSDPGVSCPPAVPIVLCGERIDEAALRLFRYYGIRSCRVLTEAGKPKTAAEQGTPVPAHEPELN